MFTRRLLFLSVLAFLVLGSCGSEELKYPGRPIIAFVTNGTYEFWEPAKAGVIKAGEDLEVNVIYRTPNSSMEAQQQVLEDLANRGIDALAVSVISPKDQKLMLEGFAKDMPMVTHDSDSPDCGRKFFVGVDNYNAGRMLGDLIRTSLPDGGNVAIFVGNLTQQNATDRWQGVVDGALGRTERGSDPTSSPVRGDNGIVILRTYTDDDDKPKAKANVVDALNGEDPIAAIVGLFQYNPAQALLALEDRGELGKAQVFGFDEHARTLQAIEDGHCAGTVVQNPYMYGYESVRLLLALEEKKDPGVSGDFHEIPARLITTKNLAAFREELNEQMSVLKR